MVAVDSELGFVGDCAVDGSSTSKQQKDKNLHSEQ